MRKIARKPQGFLFSPLSPGPPMATIACGVSVGMNDPLSIPDAKSVFEILVREHTDMLTAYLRSLLGADPSVDDLFQQAMLVAWRRLGDYDRTRPFGPWLRGIAQRLVLEHHRKRLSRPICTDPQVLAELDIRFDEVSKLSGDTFRERVERLRECLSKLPDAMRHAIELVYARGLMIAAAAESLGAGEEAVKKRVQRGRQLLADCLVSGTIDDAAASAERRTP